VRQYHVHLTSAALCTNPGTPVTQLISDSSLHVRSILVVRGAFVVCKLELSSKSQSKWPNIYTKADAVRVMRKYVEVTESKTP
jgi:hypothetical protein